MSKFVTLCGFRSPSGAELNFEVIGSTTQPSSASENTIWVNTDTAISGWKFSSSEPENAIEGIVWIYTGSSSGVGFDIIENVKVYPIYAKQYIDGVWVDKTAKIYQGGKWSNLGVYLFNNGYLGLSGGFDWRDNANTQTLGTFTVLDTLVLTINTTNAISLAWTKNAVDLTPYKTIRFDIDFEMPCTTDTDRTQCICISTGTGAGVNLGQINMASRTGRQIAEIDVTSINQYAYVGFRVGSYPYANKMTVYSIELIPKEVA